MNFAQIIVYRSPFDQWLWESGIAWGLIYTAVGTGLLIVAGIGLSVAWEWVKDQWKARKRK